MRIRNSMLWLLAVLALAGAACGDDDNDDGGNGNGGDDAGSDNGGTNGATNGDSNGTTGGMVDLSKTCAADGTYMGFTAMQVFEKVGDKGGCITDVNVAELCAKNPSKAAGTAGSSCALNGLEGEALRKCTIDGDSGLGIDGLRKAAPKLSDACLVCYADSVACSAKNCLSECVGMPMAEGCIKCREDKGCTPAFYTCAGLPRTEELK